MAPADLPYQGNTTAVAQADVVGRGKPVGNRHPIAGAVTLMLPCSSAAAGQILHGLNAILTDMAPAHD